MNTAEGFTESQLIREAKLEKARRIQENKYKYFVPNGRGEGFLHELGSQRYFIGLYSAANGVGKTTTMCAALAEMIWPTPGGHPWIKGPLFTNFPYLKKIRIVSDPHVVESIIAEMKLWFPKGRYVTWKGRKSYEAFWKTDNDFEIEIMTYDQDPKEFEGGNIGFIWCDEPPPKNIHKANVARLRNGGQLVITATPLKGSEWMYDDILANPNNDAGLRFFVEATVEDACKIHGVRGHLEHENILKIVSQYDEDEKQARVFGKFQHLTGLVFKMFQPKIHVIPAFDINFKDYTVYHYLDPHPRTEDAAAWYAVDKFNRKFVVDEFFKNVKGEGELAHNIKQRNSGYRIVRMAGDPSMFIEDQHKQTSLAKTMMNHGLYYEEATKARAASDRRIKDALNYTAIGDPANGGKMLMYPELYIFDTCTRHIWELNHYRWDEWTGKNAEKHGPKQKPIDKDDHMIENLGRFLFSEPGFEPYYKHEEDIEPINDDPY